MNMKKYIVKVVGWKAEDVFEIYSSNEEMALKMAKDMFSSRYGQRESVLEAWVIR